METLFAAISLLAGSLLAVQRRVHVTGEAGRLRGARLQQTIEAGGRQTGEAGRLRGARLSPASRERACG